MSVDEIITLDDNKEYILLSQTNVDNSKYFLAVEAINNEPSEQFKIFKEIIDNNQLYIEEVNDKEMINNLIDAFEESYDENKAEG